MRNKQSQNLGMISQPKLRNRYAQDWPTPGSLPRVPSGARASAQINNNPQLMSDNPRAMSEQGADVRAVFDSRPVNCIDFNQCPRIESWSADGVGIADFPVPSGVVALARKITIFQSNSTNKFGNPYPVIPTVTVFVNGTVQAGIAQLRYPVYNLPDGIDVFFYADAGDTISVQVDYGESDEPLFCDVLLYGNYLVSQGIPPQFEVGNYKKPAVKDTGRLIGARGPISSFDANRSSAPLPNQSQRNAQPQSQKRLPLIKRLGVKRQ